MGCPPDETRRPAGVRSLSCRFSKASLPAIRNASSVGQSPARTRIRAAKEMLELGRPWSVYFSCRYRHRAARDALERFVEEEIEAHGHAHTSSARIPRRASANVTSGVGSIPCELSQRCRRLRNGRDPGRAYDPPCMLVRLRVAGGYRAAVRGLAARSIPALVAIQVGRAVRFPNGGVNVREWGECSPIWYTIRACPYPSCIEGRGPRRV